MKKIYLALLVLIIAVGGVQAQDIFKMDTTLVKGQFASGDADIHKIKTYATNLTDEDIELNWTVTKIEGPSEWVFQLCDNGLCYDVKEDFTTTTFPFDVKCLFEAGANSNKIAGTGKMEVKVEHKSDDTKFEIVTFEWDFSLGMNNIQKTSFELFPNPVSSTLFINFSDKDFGQNVKVKVFNLVGQIQQGVELIQSTDGITADVKGLRNGTYLVQLINEDGETVTQRFTKRG